MFDLIWNIAMLGGRRIPRPFAWLALASGCVLMAAAVVGLPPTETFRLAVDSFKDPDQED